jgi:hypothetical protein
MFEFINMVLLLLLVNAKVPELNIPDSFPILGGRFTDFNVPWYRSVGSTIMLTMLLNVIVPHLAEQIFYLIALFKRWRDRGYTRD